MRTDLFDFDLPDDRIALHPATPRDAARLLVIRPPLRLRGEGRGLAPASASVAAPPPGPLPAGREGGSGGFLDDRSISDLPDLLRPGDALVLNDTRVIRAALRAERLREE